MESNEVVFNDRPAVCLRLTPSAISQKFSLTIFVLCASLKKILIKRMRKFCSVSPSKYLNGAIVECTILVKITTRVPRVRDISDFKNRCEVGTNRDANIEINGFPKTELWARRDLNSHALHGTRF